MPGIVDSLKRCGGLATRAQLNALGHADPVIRSAVASGRVLAIGRRWIATHYASADAIRALALRGVLGGASALRSYSVWVTDTRGLVVATRPKSGRLPALARGETRLWRPYTTSGRFLWRVSIDDALAGYLPSLEEPRDIVATLDSVLHRRLMTRERLDALLSRMPLRVRRLRGRVNGAAESGLETFLRLAFEDAGWRVEVQHRIRGVGRVDLLVDGWLVIEADGFRHDEVGQAMKDRQRNTALVLLGFRWHRFGYEEIMADLAGCVAVVRLLHAGGPPRSAS